MSKVIKPKNPKILFISCMSIMEPKNASMYFFGKLLDKYSTSFYWFSLSQKKSNFNKWKVPYESSGPIKISILNSKLLKYINFYPWAVLRGLKAAIFGKKNNVDLVLADIAFESILVSRVASNILNIPLISSIHDDPVNRLKKKNYSPSFVELYERVFHKTLKKSKRCIVISDYMGKYYSKKYNIKFKTLFLGPDENKLLPIKNIKNDNKPFVFGSVGSINHASNFETFLESCMQKNNLKNYPLLRVNVIGNNDIQISESFQEIASLKGWINNQSFQEELKIINAGFLTSTFKQSEKVQSITSFPLKIHSFIQAGVPIFSISPNYSSIANFLQDTGCGINCNSLSIHRISKSLTEFIDLHKKNRFETAIIELREKLNEKLFYHRFINILKNVL